MTKHHSHTVAILGYNNHKLTINAIKQLRKIGCDDSILFFDNGSTPSFENLLDDKNIIYLRKEENLFVNPAWNEIFDIVDTKYLTLLNNDCFVESDNYFKDIIPHMENNDIIISSCKTKNVKFYNPILKYIYQLKYRLKFQDEKLQFTNNARRQGWLMTINLDVYKSLDYKIPDYLKVWYGDDWIWSQMLLNDKNTAIYTNKYALHVKGSSTSKIPEIIQSDVKNIEKFGDWYKKTTHIMHGKKYA
ncbi:MAG: glycosyltransferase [Candidatus Marinimicrobia bacterium]|nr:glycosyltransferase [Candidatus Neomarinimicrobiota bacterium]